MQERLWKGKKLRRVGSSAGWAIVEEWVTIEGWVTVEWWVTVEG